MFLVGDDFSPSDLSQLTESLNLSSSGVGYNPSENIFNVLAQYILECVAILLTL